MAVSAASCGNMNYGSNVKRDEVYGKYRVENNKNGTNTFEINADGTLSKLTAV
jgi:hypothetical protein